MAFRVLDVLPLASVVAGFLASAILSENAARFLVADQKAQVMDAFASARKFHIVVGGLVATTVWRLELGWALIAVYFVGACLWGTRRLRRLQLPEAASQRYLAGHIVMAAGVLLGAIVVLMRNWS
jgi:hypothetical protein